MRRARGKTRRRKSLPTRSVAHYRKNLMRSRTRLVLGKSRTISTTANDRSGRSNHRGDRDSGPYSGRNFIVRSGQWAAVHWRHVLSGAHLAVSSGNRLNAYAASIRRLAALAPRVKLVLGAHNIPVARRCRAAERSCRASTGCEQAKCGYAGAGRKVLYKEWHYRS